MKKEEIIEKKWYDVKVEAKIPATLTYRIYAEDPLQATEMIKYHQPVAVKHKLSVIDKLKVTVYKMGCSVIEFSKVLK